VEGWQEGRRLYWGQRWRAGQVDRKGRRTLRSLRRKPHRNPCLASLAPVEARSHSDVVHNAHLSLFSNANGCCALSSCFRLNCGISLSLPSLVIIGAGCDLPCIV
jgi:hypothetical protein